MDLKGIDCATPLTLDNAKAVAALGYEFVCRYLVPAAYAWKRLTRTEAQALTEAGLQIISVWETSANRAAGGAAAGQIDGPLALNEAQTVGQPAGTAIYFAVDYDARPADYDAIENYLRAAAAALPGYSVGVYGSYAVVEEMALREACGHFWQTYAWSRGQRSSHANLYQYQNEVTVAGIQADLDESFGNEGFWNTAAAPTGPFPDVPPDRWSASAIEIVKNAGLMVGFPDGTFRPTQPTTREELAVVLAKLLTMIET
ncbi:glycoside hydrolase domain-containing protein [Ferviditalea candida]|uniref:glycoside hydrolase domain-containing protein n=1 Tax=Ferviditalea candida TaxID=3108399 RepID=UPI00352F0F0F